MEDINNRVKPFICSGTNVFKILKVVKIDIIGVNNLLY